MGSPYQYKAEYTIFKRPKIGQEKPGLSYNSVEITPAEYTLGFTGLPSILASFKSELCLAMFSQEMQVQKIK